MHGVPIDGDAGGDFVFGFVGEGDLRAEPVDHIVQNIFAHPEGHGDAFVGKHIQVLRHKLMRKTLAFILALALCFGITACAEQAQAEETLHTEEIVTQASTSPSTEEIATQAPTPPTTEETEPVTYTYKAEPMQNASCFYYGPGTNVPTISIRTECGRKSWWRPNVPIAEKRITTLLSLIRQSWISPWATPLCTPIPIPVGIAIGTKGSSDSCGQSVSPESPNKFFGSLPEGRLPLALKEAVLSAP